MIINHKASKYFEDITFEANGANLKTIPALKAKYQLGT